MPPHIVDIPVGTPVRVDLVTDVEEWPLAGYRDRDHGPRRVRAGRVSDLTRRPTHGATRLPALPEPNPAAEALLFGGGAMSVIRGGIVVTGALWAVPLVILSLCVAVLGAYRLLEPCV